MKKRIATWAILLLAFFGLADSVYLVQHEMNGMPLLCDPNTTLSGCNIVAQSPYAYLFGIPIAEYGIFFYGLLFFVAAFEILLFRHLIRRVIQGLALLGFVMSVYFVSVQFFIINALCIYCLASAAIVFLVFTFSFLLESMRKNGGAYYVPVAVPAPTHPHLPMPPSA
ncbi:MAG TPA: vitamin K epoxide reductase family protein [Candidatus Paceibacterota bacterium]|nr:vitamin K epoxide reductase family protein [Candidatus Paceibacterota bacterium]